MAISPSSLARIVDQDALDLFQRKDAHLANAEKPSSADLAELRYLAMRAVGLHETGFTDEEQVPWSPSPKVVAAWRLKHALNEECMTVIKKWEQEPHLYLRDRSRYPAWQVFDDIVHNSPSMVGMQPPWRSDDGFRQTHFTDTLDARACYRWQECEGSIVHGRVFSNPIAAAQWLLAHAPGTDYATMDSSYLVCPHAERNIYTDVHGTGKWARDVLHRVEQNDLTLALTAVNAPIADPKPRTRL